MSDLPTIDLRPYLERIRRRKWWIAIPLCLSILAGAVYVALTPKQYRASTLILVEAQRVPNSYVQQTVTESLQSRLHTISQQVNSRTNLERVIEQFALFDRQEADTSGWQKTLKTIKNKAAALIGLEAPADEAEQAAADQSVAGQVKSVREKINISLKSGNRAFEISFVWKNPQMAAQVANALASQFIEQNLRVREEMAMGTTNFLDNEVDRIRRELIQRETALEQFKKEHMGKLPEQLASNLNLLSQKREELDNLEKRVAMEQQEAIMLKNQMNLNEKQFALEAGSLPLDEGVSEIVQLQEHLETLQSRYTEKHPDVRALKRRIENLKAKTDSPGSEAEGETEPPRSLTPGDLLRPQLKQIYARIARYEEAIQELKAEIAEYQQRVEQTSKVELELKNLERDYQAVNDRYQSLLSKKLNAQMAEELEKRQKGEQFRVVDPAIAPGNPFSPDVKKIMLMAVVLGTGLGGGLAFAWEVITPVFYTHEELEKYLGTDVLVSLPFADTKQRRWRWWRGKRG